MNIPAPRQRLSPLLFLLVAVLLAAALLLWSRAPTRGVGTRPFVLAAGPQLTGRYGLGGSATISPIRAYLEAVERGTSLKIALAPAATFDQALSRFERNQADGVTLVLATSQAQLPATALLSPSFYRGSSVLVSRRAQPYDSLAALAGKRVGVIADGEYQAYLARQHPRIQVLPLRSPSDMVAAVTAGAADAALGMDAVFIPLAQRSRNPLLSVHAADDAPAVDLRVASWPQRAGDIARAHATFRALPLAIQQGVTSRWLNTLYRAPPTLRAVLAHYRVTLIALAVAGLGILLAVVHAWRSARATAAMHAATMRALTLANHEVRNSATLVMAAIDQLPSTPGVSTDPSPQEAARVAASSLQHMLANVLEYAFLDRPGNARGQWQPTALAVLRECVFATGPLAARKGIALTLSIDPAVPPALCCDVRALRHLATNLVSNAVKFCDQGGVEVRLRFEAGVGGLGRVLLEVTDSGPGIAPAVVKTLFDPLHASSADGRRRGGAGMGLALCHRIAVAQGGSIGVDSRLGGGSTFTAMLPGRDCAEGAPMREATVPAVPVHCAGDALVVEDEPTVAAAISQHLRHRGFTVTHAVSGEAATVAMRQQGPFTLVTLDGTLLEQSGSEVLAALRAVERQLRWPSAPVVSVSGEPVRPGSPRYADAGVIAYLSKPIDWNAFAAAISLDAQPCVAPAPAPINAEILMIYRAQLPKDLAALHAEVSSARWRNALAMTHRIRGAASLVGDTDLVEAVTGLDRQFKSHAINGGPAANGMAAITRCVERIQHSAMLASSH